MNDFVAIPAVPGRRMAISPSRWGGVVWDTLHYFTLGYPEADPPPAVRRAALDLMASLVHLLPCELCRVHLAEAYRVHLPLTPAVVESRQAFGAYVVALRDLVKRKHVDAGRGLPARLHRFPEDVEARLLGAPATLGAGVLADPGQATTLGVALAFLGTLWYLMRPR